MNTPESDLNAPAVVHDASAIIRMALAVTDMEKMVDFYNNVFGANLEPFEMNGMKLYNGTILGIKFLFAPNEMAGIVAEQSRHQFDIRVADIDAVAAAAEASGGNLRDGIATYDKQKVLSVEDPDGNTMVFIQDL